MTPETVQTTGPSAAGLGVASNARASGTATTLAELVDAYMTAYAGHDRTRVTQLTRWVALLGDRAFASLTDENLFRGLETIRNEPARVYMGRDADGRRIERAKGK